MKTGTILSFDPMDGLGVIRLDDGTEVRFGMSSLVPHMSKPEAGVRVRVASIEEGFGGRLRAKGVEPEGLQFDETVFEWPTVRESVLPKLRGRAALVQPFDLDAFAAKHPDFASAVPRFGHLAPSDTAPWSKVKHPKVPPFFGPWEDQLLAMAAPALGASLHAADPDPSGARFGGPHAHLDGDWPTCAACSTPQTVLADIGPEDLAMWGFAEQRLATFFCAACAKAKREYIDAHARRINSGDVASAPDHPPIIPRPLPVTTRVCSASAPMKQSPQGTAAVAAHRLKKVTAFVEHPGAHHFFGSLPFSTLKDVRVREASGERVYRDAFERAGGFTVQFGGVRTSSEAETCPRCGAQLVPLFHLAIKDLKGLERLTAYGALLVVGVCERRDLGHALSSAAPRLF